MLKKIDLLRNVHLFSKLKDEELKVVAGLSRYYMFSKGQVIFNAGTKREELCIIKKGEVLISKKEQNGSNQDLARFIAHESFGELELLDNAPRTTTAVAEKDTILLIFPMKGAQFSDILNKYSKIFALVLHELIAMIAGRIRSTNKLISEKTPWVQDLRRQLLSDKLTGLFNRTFLEEDFASLLHEYGETTSLIMLKPDNFKEINDTFGHEAGDRALKLIADTVKSMMREDDVAVRYRGDEFAAVLPNTGTESAYKFAEELRSAFHWMKLGHLTEGKIDTITVSMGISTYPSHADDSKGLIKSAFNRMFEARNSGGNCIRN